MESNTPDRSTLARRLAAIWERLRALGALLQTDNSESSAVRAAVASAIGAIEEVQSLVTDPREATRVACRFCGARVMPDAIRCFSCWHKLEPSIAR